MKKFELSGSFSRSALFRSKIVHKNTSCLKKFCLGKPPPSQKTKDKLYLPLIYYFFSMEFYYKSLQERLTPVENWASRLTDNSQKRKLLK